MSRTYLEFVFNIWKYRYEREVEKDHSMHFVWLSTKCDVLLSQHTLDRSIGRKKSLTTSSVGYLN